MIGEPSALPADLVMDKPSRFTPPAIGEPSEDPPAAADAAAQPTPGPPAPVDDGAVDPPLSEALPYTSESAPAEGAADDMPRGGDLCRGRVVGIAPGGVVVDFGRKTEGLVAIEEFAKASDLPQLGDDIDVIFQNRGGAGDYASLSYQRARRLLLWESIEKAHRDGSPLPARVVSTVKGGLGVDIGLPAFLPSSQVDLRPSRDAEGLVGTEFPVQIVEFSRARGNVVVSRRALLEKEMKSRKAETLSKISLGAVVNGTVKNLTSYGAFVDLGGIDALLHITDLSYSRVEKLSDIVQAGESINAKVIKFDPERERVSLSLKAMEPDPWEGLEERCQVGDRVRGRVTRIVEFGLFIEIEKGLEGLLHVGEISWSKHHQQLSKKFKTGQTVDCAVLKVEAEKRRLSLSVKALTPDPWATVAERYPTGAVVEGKVLSVASYGAFVEVEEGIEGLIHITDLTRGEKVRHPKEILRKGCSVHAAVLRVDDENRRLALGMKQLEPDAWDDFSASHLVGDVMEGRVLRRTSFGVFVELASGVEALCHVSELAGKGKGKSKGSLAVGRVYYFRILDLDDLERRVRLSRRGAPPHEVKAPSASERGSLDPESKAGPRKTSPPKKARRRRKAVQRDEPGAAADAKPPETPEATVQDEAAFGVSHAEKDPGEAIVPQSVMESPVAEAAGQATSPVVSTPAEGESTPKSSPAARKEAP